MTCKANVFLLCLDFPGFSCTYIEKYAHLDFSFQMRNTAFRLLWSKVKRSKIGLFSGPFLLTGRVLISLFTNSPKIYLSVHRLCHLLLQNIFLCRRKKSAYRGQRTWVGIVLHRFLIGSSCSNIRTITVVTLALAFESRQDH